MALNIPLPGVQGDVFGKAIDSGSTILHQMMQPILEREKQQQLERHFQEQLKLSKAAAGRAAQAAADAHRIALNKLDPTFQARQFEALENYYRSKGQPGVQGMAMPTQETGEGMGMFTPEGMHEAQQQAQQASQGQSMPGGLNDEHLNLMRQYPPLRAMYKKIYKFDPLAGESSVLHGAARDAADLDKLRRQVGEDSPVYQDARAAYDAQLDAKKDLRDLRARTKQGLKPGEKEFFDPQTGEALGKEIPLTAKERESEEGNILFNELYPSVYRGASPFSGEGSISRLNNAAANYKTDPMARKLFDDLLLADKAMAATVVNEASTLKAGHTNQTYNRLQAALEAQDIPRLIKKLIKEYKIPASAQLKAAMRYQKLLSDARNKARKGTPATQKLFYNPEMQKMHEDNGSSEFSHMSDEELKAIAGGG